MKRSGINHILQSAQAFFDRYPFKVSQVNDDHLDNRFYDAVGRFPSIVEDAAPWRLLVSDYAAMASQ